MRESSKITVTHELKKFFSAFTAILNNIKLNDFKLKPVKIKCHL